MTQRRDKRRKPALQIVLPVRAHWSATPKADLL
jgi:hypothetical protein